MTSPRPWAAPEIESHYGVLPFVAEMCVLDLGAASGVNGHAWHALVVPDRDALRTRKVVNVRELLRFEFETLSVLAPKSARLSGFDVTFSPLPKTPEGAVDWEAAAGAWQRLRAQRAGGARRQGPAPPPPSDQLAARVVAMLAARHPGVAVTLDSSLELDLELDSIGRVETLAGIEADLGATLDDAAASDAMTVAELVSAIRESSRGPSRSSAATSADAGPTPASQDTWARLLATAPAEDEFVAELRRPKPVRMFLGFLALRGAALLARLAIGLRASGLEHIPRTGPYLLCPNHVTFLDGFLLCMVLPLPAIRAMFFVGASEYFATPLSARLAKSINLVPVDPDAGLVRALRVAAQGLRAGRVLILFPEGERTIDGELKMFRRGGPILASRLGVPIVPVAIEGAYELWPRSLGIQWGRLWPPGRHRTRLRIGAPFTPGEDGVPGDEAAVAEILRARVKTLQDALRRAPARHG